VDIIFSGDEQVALQKQLGSARFNTRRGTISVPRLSLGAVNLPAPKGRDASQDALMISGVPLFVEQVSQLGIMSEENALDLLKNRLAQFYIHGTEYQFGVEQAIAVRLRLERVLAQIDEEIEHREEKVRATA
jgi:hypothetical protein